MAKIDFQRFAIKNGSQIDRRRVKKDIADLKRITKPIVKYMHKVVAHKNKRQISIKATVNDLYIAIDFIEKLVIKYNLLLTQGGISTLRASNVIPDLQSIFK